jgi:hypothetical protein
MASPYARGDTVAWLSIDPEGMRVHRAEVLGIEPEADGWRVSTTHGTEHVDMRGEGSALVPSDEEIATELAQRGDGFLVRSTTQDIRAHSRAGRGRPSAAGASRVRDRARRLRRSPA